MAGRKPSRPRIEPGFEDTGRPNDGAERVVASAPPSRRKQGKSRKSTAPRRKDRGRGLPRIVRFATYWTVVLGIWGFIAIAGMFVWYGAKLPQSSSWQIPDRPPNVRIVSADGELVANRGLTGGQTVSLDEMSPYIPMAVIAIEDRRFHSHFGIDPLGIARAMVSNVAAGHLVQGGSTLTQQLAKNLFLEPRRDLERKVQEAIIAVWLEQKFTKDEILELYLNRVYFGSGAYGVDAAARRYFSKSARDVNLAEAALLAGLLKAPSALSPARNPKGAEERAQVVLSAMRRSGFVSDREVATALSMEAKKAKHYWSGSQHYVADMIMKQLPDLIGEVRHDVVVDTTIDLDLQKEAGQLIRSAIEDSGKKLNLSQGALVSIDGTGAIRALVGGVEYADSQFNRASDAKRQPGSAFKPLVYLAAMESGLNPDSVRVDRPVAIGAWKPENYDRKYRGPVTLSEGLSLSLNTIAAQMISEVGTGKVVEVAKRLGIRTKLARNASIALGTSEVSLLELTAAYAPFANGGYLAEPFVIKRVTTQEGKVLYERKPASAAQVIDPVAVGMMNQMLERVVEEGTGKRAQVEGWEVAGKTGTTQNFRDALFVGYTANLVTGVWFGNDDGEPGKKVTGGGLPAQTFAAFMKEAHQGVPVAELPGFYLPKTVAVIPTPRPGRGIGSLLRPRQQSGTPVAVNQGANRTSVNDQVRRPLSGVNGAPRPGAGLEGNPDGQKKRKNLIELLLGG